MRTPKLINSNVIHGAMVLVVHGENAVATNTTCFDDTFASTSSALLHRELLCCPIPPPPTPFFVQYPFPFHSLNPEEIKCSLDGRLHCSGAFMIAFFTTAVNGTPRQDENVKRYQSPAATRMEPKEHVLGIVYIPKKSFL